jgi:hypothetical protein
MNIINCLENRPALVNYYMRSEVDITLIIISVMGFLELFNRATKVTFAEPWILKWAPTSLHQGQAYVALSRVNELNGLFIEGINLSKIKCHPKVAEFYRISINRTISAYY